MFLLTRTGTARHGRARPDVRLKTYKTLSKKKNGTKPLTSLVPKNL